MFKTDSYGRITMNENDFGVILPINFFGGNLLDEDKITFIIEKSDNEKVIEKDFEVTSNKIDFQLTKEETDKLPVRKLFI